MPTEERAVDWRYRYSNTDILQLVHSVPIRNFYLMQHLKYIAHVTRLPNSAMHKQVLSRANKKLYSRDPGKLNMKP